MSNAFAFVFLLVFLFLGTALIVGANRKWSWLVDPPEYLWPVYSQAFIKKVFGKRALETFAYSIGSLFILFSLVAIANALMLKFAR